MGVRGRSRASAQNDVLLSEEQALGESLGQAARDRKTKIQQITDAFRSQKNVTHTGVRVPRTKTAPLASQTKPRTAVSDNRMDEHNGEETNDPLLMLHQTLLHTMLRNEEGKEASMRSMPSGGSNRLARIKHRKPPPATHQQAAEHATALLHLHQVRSTCTCTWCALVRTLLGHTCIHRTACHLMHSGNGAASPRLPPSLPLSSTTLGVGASASARSIPKMQQ